MIIREEIEALPKIGTFTRILKHHNWTVGDSALCAETFILRGETRIVKGDVLTIRDMWEGITPDKDWFWFEERPVSIDRYNLGWYFFRKDL